MTVICDYCGDVAQFVDGGKIYPHRPDLNHLKFFLCSPCNAYVGVHIGTTKPFGRLANAELRSFKQKAHLEFDKLWKSGRFTRKESYSMLSGAMNKSIDLTHIGMFNVSECKQVVELCKSGKIYDFHQTVD